MSDALLADIARRLAQALAIAGHSRSDADRKDVALLQTELVAAYRDEVDEQPSVEQPE